MSTETSFAYFEVTTKDAVMNGLVSWSWAGVCQYVRAAVGEAL